MVESIKMPLTGRGHHQWSHPVTARDVESRVIQWSQDRQPQRKWGSGTRTVIIKEK